MPKVTYRNYGQLEKAEIDISGPITLLCGRNDQGKSTALRGLSTLLTGDTTPATGQAQHDLPLICRKGAVRGEVLLQGEHCPGHKAFTFTNKAIVGVEARDGSIDGLPEADPIAAGIKRAMLMRLKPADRDARFFEIWPVSPTRGDLDSHLSAQGVDRSSDKLWDKIETKGWDAVWNDIKAEIPETKARWKEVTGEDYGARKAETWEAKPPAVADDGTAHNSETGEVIDKIPSVDDLKAALEEAERALEAARAARQKLPDSVSNPAHQHRCPQCAEPLMLKDGSLQPYKSMPERELKEIDLAIGSACGKLSRAETDRNRAERALLEAQVAARTRSEMQADDLKRRTERATRLHQTVKRLVDLEKAVGPKGARKDVRAKVLDGVNKDLLAITAPLGLGEAMIEWVKQPGGRGEAMTVFVNGHAYQALGRRVRWMVDLALQVLIAKATGSRMILIDDSDVVIDGEGKGRVIRTLRDSGIPAVAAMAMAKPESALDLSASGAGRTYWVEGGGIKPLAAVRSAAATSRAA